MGTITDSLHGDCGNPPTDAVQMRASRHWHGRHIRWLSLAPMAAAPAWLRGVSVSRTSLDLLSVVSPSPRRQGRWPPVHTARSEAGRDDFAMLTTMTGTGVGRAVLDVARRGLGCLPDMNHDGVTDQRRCSAAWASNGCGRQTPSQQGGNGNGTEWDGHGRWYSHVGGAGTCVSTGAKGWLGARVGGARITRRGMHASASDLPCCSTPTLRGPSDAV